MNVWCRQLSYMTLNQPQPHVHQFTKCENCVIEPNSVDFLIQCNHLVNDWNVWTQHSNYSKKIIVWQISLVEDIVNVILKHMSNLCVLCSVNHSMDQIHYYWPMSEADGVQCTIYSIQRTTYEPLLFKTFMENGDRCLV